MAEAEAAQIAAMVEWITKTEAQAPAEKTVRATLESFVKGLKVTDYTKLEGSMKRSSTAVHRSNEITMSRP